MRSRFKSLVTALAATAVLAGAAQAGPIRDLIKNIKEKRSSQDAAGSLQAVTVNYQGIDRTFYAYVPASVAGKSGVSAVIVFHGGGGDAQGIVSSTDMTAVAESLGFVALFPEVVKGQWNDGRAESASAYDDVGYVRAILGNSESLYGVGLGNVFAAGISNGGMFTQRLVCDAADMFTAVAVVSANMPADYQGSCNPSRAVPKIFFNGTTDPIMPWDGGEIKSLKVLGLGAGGKVLSHAKTESFWLNKDGCSADASQQALPDAANDGTSVSVATYANCSGSTQLEFVAIDGGGHSWPGSSEPARRMAGKTSQDISATEEMVQFFQGYGL